MTTSYRCVEWNPVTYALAVEGFAAQSCISRMVTPYWGDMPGMAAEMTAEGNFADWTSLQHWAVWRDHLIGLGTMRCHADGGNAAERDMARIRWRHHEVIVIAVDPRHELAGGQIARHDGGGS